VKTGGFTNLSKAILVIILASLGGIVPAEDFTIDAQRITSGGGLSSGTLFSVEGSIAQSDAGPVLSGGGFDVQGGIWSLYQAVQTVDAPTLAIVRGGANVDLKWPTGAGGFVLETSGSLGPTASWSTVPSPAVLNGNENVVNLVASPGTHFFRLRKP
jgi:hypothetical protein